MASTARTRSPSRRKASLVVKSEMIRSLGGGMAVIVDVGDLRAAIGRRRRIGPDELVQCRARLKGCEPGKLIKFWSSNWGPKPREAGCLAPTALRIELGFQQ